VRSWNRKVEEAWSWTRGRIHARGEREVRSHKRSDWLDERGGIWPGGFGVDDSKKGASDEDGVEANIASDPEERPTSIRWPPWCNSWSAAGVDLSFDIGCKGCDVVQAACTCEDNTR